MLPWGTEEVKILTVANMCLCIIELTTFSPVISQEKIKAAFQSVALLDEETLF